MGGEIRGEIRLCSMEDQAPKVSHRVPVLARFCKPTASIRVEAPCAMQQLSTLTMEWCMEVGQYWVV